jgi:hypothetical protein
MRWWIAPGSKSTIGKLEPAFWGVLFDWLHFERHAIAKEIINSPDFDETPARKRADQ